MAYAKFVTRLNREGKPIRYGPYYYKSVRTPEGKVRNIYIGMTPETVVVQVPEQIPQEQKTPEQPGQVPEQTLEQAQASELKENESVTKGTRRIRKFLARLVNS